jgi:hypothetical protein
MSKRIFISYGTADAREIAEWLFQGLRDLGYEPWWDKAQLPQQAGRAWDEQIEKAIRSSDVVLALMSPHSVRPQGECRNEINFACDQSKPVVPVMVRKCDRPLRLNSLQYIDLEGFEYLPEEARRQRLKLLCAAIEDGPKDDPACHELYTQFQRFDFDWIYTRHRNLTGRTWLMDKFDAWLRHDAEPVLVLVGGPGVGKSAVLAEWVKTRMHVGAVHYCRHDRHDLRSPEAMVASLSGQLLRHEIPGHREALQAFLRDPHAQRDAGSMLHRLVLDPLRKQSGDRPWVLAIDALDEGGESIYELLASVRPYLDPRRIRLLLTSRPEAEVLQLFEHKLVLSAEGRENQADLQAYVHARLAQSSIGANLASGRLQAIEQQILDRCEGNFLIAQVTLDELDAGRMTPEQVESLPTGLGALYAGYFQRRFTTKESFAPVRAVLEIVMGAFEPVPDEFIARVLGVGTRRVAESLQALGSLLPRQGPQGVRVPFHKSLLDWLESLEPGTKFACSRETGMERLAQALESVEFDGVYSLRWRIKHLHAAGRLESAQNWLLNLNHLQLRVDAGLGRAVLEDLDLLPANESLVELRALCRQRMALWISKDTAVMEDTINQTVYGGNLHRLAEAQTPRPYLEVASDRPALALTDRVLPHKGVEFAIPLSPEAGANDHELRIVTFSADCFIVWSDVGEKLHQGPLFRVELSAKRDAMELLEAELSTLGLESLDFGFRGGFCSGRRVPHDHRWFHEYSDGCVHVVRSSLERIDYVVLGGDDGRPVVGIAQSPRSALLAVRFSRFMNGGPSAPYYLRLSPLSSLVQSAYVVCRSDSREPVFLIPRNDLEVHGQEIPAYMPSSWRGINNGMHPGACSAIVSSSGEIMTLLSGGVWWIVNLRLMMMAEIGIIDGVKAITWSQYDDQMLQLGRDGHVRTINRVGLSGLKWRNLSTLSIKSVGIAADDWRAIVPDLIDVKSWSSAVPTLEQMQMIPIPFGGAIAPEGHSFMDPNVAILYLWSYERESNPPMFAWNAVGTYDQLSWEEVKCLVGMHLGYIVERNTELMAQEKSLDLDRAFRDDRIELCQLVHCYSQAKLRLLDEHRGRALELRRETSQADDPGREVRVRVLQELRYLYRYTFLQDTIEWGRRWVAASKYFRLPSGQNLSGSNSAPSVQQALQVIKDILASGATIKNLPPEALQVWELWRLPLLGSATVGKSMHVSTRKAAIHLKLRWKSASELEALKEPGDRVSTFDVQGKPGKREHLVLQGAFKHDPVKSGKFPPLGKAVEWDESGVRIRAGVLEIQRNGANPGRLMMGVAIKGYLQNPFDRDLIAAIDVQGRVLVMRVQR